jgi:hypothetical protein
LRNFPVDAWIVQSPISHASGELLGP